MKKLAALADKYFIDDWRKEWRRLWSIRVALFWGAICGVYSAWGALQGVIPAPIFVAVSAIMCAVIAGARVTKQPGASE